MQEKLYHWLVVGVWGAMLPVMTLAWGPLRPFLLRKSEVNPVWDPIYSLGFSFIHNGARHNDTNPSPMAILGWLFMALVFCLIAFIGYKIGKSHIAAHWKWLLFVVIVASFCFKMSVERAGGIHYLHFFRIEIS